MFGFPTRVRASTAARRAASRTTTRASCRDRPLDMAVSSFAPGAEILRDKQIHLCVGFAAYDFAQGRDLRRSTRSATPTHARRGAASASRST